MDDDKLLTLYARDGSEAAFGQLVARHLMLVYSTCLREIGSPSLAEDAAQVVFLLLARKAKTLRAVPSLAGWLFKAARFVAKDVRKQEARRQQREQSVIQEMTHQQELPTPEWERVEPLLNDALSALKPQEREAVLLRFIEGHSLTETGVALALSEDAARMRVSRAVEKMRRYLTAHGAAVTGAILTGLLTSEAARPVPAHAANIITQGTLQALSGVPKANVLQLSEGVYQTMKMTKMKRVALAAAVLLGGAVVPPLAHAVNHNSTSGQAAQVDQAQQNAFLLGLTLFDCNQRERKYIEETNLAGGPVQFQHFQGAARKYSYLSRYGAGAREGEAASYKQIAQSLREMNAPADLQDWASQSAVRLSSPLKPSPNPGAPLTEEEAAVYATANEFGDTLAATKDHQVALLSWLKREGNDIIWSESLGSLTGALNFRAVVQGRQEGRTGIEALHGLAATAPSDAPLLIREDLNDLDGIEQNPQSEVGNMVHSWDKVRHDLLTTFSVKPTQIWPY